MPGKSRRRRGKPSARSKKGHGAITGVAQQQVAAETYEPAVPAPTLPSRPGSLGAPAGVLHPYIGNELRRIGILAGIILVILIVLAIVLS